MPKRKDKVLIGSLKQGMSEDPFPKFPSSFGKHYERTVTTNN